MARPQAEITNGPISTKSQATQTLLAQTQISTQLMSHEVHQYTQIINHDSVEHVGGDTLVNDSDPEGSGNTIILHDDDDGDDAAAHGDAESGSFLKGKAGAIFQGQSDADPLVAPLCKIKSVAGKTELHVEGHEVAPSKCIDDSVALHICRDLPHSDATTEEEGDVENIGYLDADAESQPLHFNAAIHGKGAHLSKKTLEIVQPDVVNKQDILGSQKTPEAALVADMIGKKSSQSRRPSIASVRAESLHASGLRAASRGASIGLEGKDDGNLDLVTTVELTGGIFNGELNKPSEALGTELETTCANNAANVDSAQLSPKATLPIDGTTVRSPCMSTSKSKPKGVSLGCVSHQHASDQEHIDADAMNGLNTDNPESMSAPLESVSRGLRRLRSQASVVSAKKMKRADGANDVNVKVQPRQSSNQKARKLVFDIIDTPPTKLSDRLEDGGTASPKASGARHDDALTNVIDALARQRQSSLPSGFRAASANLSYLESQEPGEESQANALNVVDKLVWLDATCISDDVVTSPVPQDSTVKGHAGSNGRQSLAQAAQMKTLHDKLDVFDWEDSQVDEDDCPDAKQVPANTKSRKRHLEHFESTTDRRKRVAPQELKTQTALCMDKTGDNSRKEKCMTPVIGKSEVPNVEPSTTNQEVKPHTLLTTRLRDRIKAESRPSMKGRKSLGSNGKPMEHAHKEKPIDHPIKDFKSEQQRGSDNKVQQASKEQKLAEKIRKGRKVQQADSLSIKNKEALKTYEVGCQIQDHLVLADQTSQDDAAADLWIDAFTNTKNKAPAGSSEEVKKFRKRSALHEDTRQDSKKHRTTESATLICNGGGQDMAEKEEVTMRNRVTPRLSIQHALEEVNAVANSQTKGRRVGTQFCTKENQDIEKKEDKMEEQSNLKTKQNSMKPRIDDSSTFSQVKGRRVGTRSIQREYQDASKPEEKPMEEYKVEGGSKTRNNHKQCKTADEAVILPVKSREANNSGSAAEYMEAENARDNDTLERVFKTRSRVQGVKNIVVASDAKEYNRARKAAIKSSPTRATADDMHEPSLSRGTMPADSDKKKPGIKTSSSKKKESLRSYRHLAANLTPDAQKSEANAHEGGGLLSPSLVINGSIGALAGGPKISKRRGGSTDVNVPGSTKTGENLASCLNKDKLLRKTKDLDSKQGDVSSTLLLRRTRSSSLCDGESQKNDAIDAGKTMLQSQGDPTTDRQSVQKGTNQSDAKKGLTKQKPATKAATKSISQQSRKTHFFEMLNSSNLVEEGRRRKRESCCIRVLFSHSLTEETIKHQKKILAKLGGQLASSALDCSHFVCNGFARSQNMLISMAAGKEVVTTLWLENCGQAHYFVDEKTYVPQDAKKEKELGFSMVTSLASARRKPLLKGVSVLVSPNTVPEPAVLKAIVESAGGQAVDKNLRSPCLDEKKSDMLFIIIANEKDYDFCVQFLGKGLKVYSEELLLHGIVTQTLDYSRYRLFENFKPQKGPR